MIKKTKSLNIYFIGIKGVGMTMLAQFLSSWGHKVSGSDISDSFLTDKALAKSKIKVFSPFSPKNLPKELDLIIYSSAYDKDNNSELKVLENNKIYEKIPIISYAEALGELFNEFKGIAVCGSHGKSTVSAFLAYVLWRAKLEPNALIGSYVKQIGGASLKGESKLLITETDEYQNKLKFFNPHAVILNNIEYDHPDFFPSEKEYVKVFADFIKKIPQSGFLLANARDKNVSQIIQNFSGKLITYAVLNHEISDEAATIDYLAHDIRHEGGYQIFKVNNLGDFKIKLWGEYNVSNALAVIAMARELKVATNKIKKYLTEFNGLDRRGERLGRYRDTLIIDDYAHHPSEIKASLQGLKDFFPKHKIITVFHPHTYTRTKVFFQEFSESFYLSDHLLILDIYGSAREKLDKSVVSNVKLAEAIKVNNKKNKLEQEVLALKDIEAGLEYLRHYIAKLSPGERKKTIVLLLGAGDVFRIGQKLLKNKNNNKK